MDANHCKIVTESLQGQRDIDEQTMASLTILTERLERLKKLDTAFSDVSLSPAARKLARQKKAVAVY